jgi:bifunctional non-homologous end joining protein LigD
VARVLARRYPKRLAVEPRKNKRGGGLYLDTARNSYAQHAVAPYAVRAIEGAPIATPLSWDEVNDRTLTAQSFNVKNIFQSMSQKPDPWKNLRESAHSLKSARRRLDVIIDKELG